MQDADSCRCAIGLCDTHRHGGRTTLDRNGVWSNAESKRIVSSRRYDDGFVVLVKYVIDAEPVGWSDRSNDIRAAARPSNHHQNQTQKLARLSIILT